MIMGILLVAGIVLGTCAIIILGRYLHENYPKTFVYLMILISYLTAPFVFKIFLVSDSTIETNSLTPLAMKTAEIKNILLTIMRYVTIPLALLTVVTFFREYLEKSKQRKVNKVFN